MKHDDGQVVIQTVAGSLAFSRDEVESVTAVDWSKVLSEKEPEIELKHDDGAPEGGRSMAGSGHAVLFERPDGEWAVKTVKVYGSRYGHPRAPDEFVLVYLCDEQMNVVEEARAPYATFERGPPRWYSLPVPDVPVPKRFYVCVNFNPHRTKGVYVHYDRSVKVSHSREALPGQHNRPVDEKYDWMIRAVIVRSK